MDKDRVLFLPSSIQIFFFLEKSQTQHLSHYYTETSYRNFETKINLFQDMMKKGLETRADA